MKTPATKTYFVKVAIQVDPEFNISQGLLEIEQAMNSGGITKHWPDCKVWGATIDMTSVIDPAT